MIDPDSQQALRLAIAERMRADRIVLDTLREEIRPQPIGVGRL